MIKLYGWPYKKYIGGSVLMNVLSAVFNIFSFTLVIPILQMLFNVGGMSYVFIPWETEGMALKDIAVNNVYFFVGQGIANWGPGRVLLILSLFLVAMTLLKTACYFGATAVMVPIRTGITRDLRTKIYDKIICQKLGYFSQSRKGDIMARLSGDVTEVEVSITSSIDMLVKNPILIIFYLTTLFLISWQLTLFVLFFAPAMLLLMSRIGRSLKQRSKEAQGLWSDILSQVEETLGGLRVIKAFLAESKMSARFRDVTARYRRKLGWVATRQALAHPVSEFLGTALIAIVMWFGGTLIISGKGIIDAPTFIFFMVILYSIIQPIKDLSKAAYGIPKGLASMERINRILDADGAESARPGASAGTACAPLDFQGSIRFENVSFRYSEDGKLILDGVNLEIPKGKTIAIVGASGAGKTTLVDLIPRFFSPTEGRITIDGRDLESVPLESLRSIMGNVNQEPILFNDTIFNNIAFGVENATMEQVVEAAKIANAHDFIMEKENGYNECVGDRGSRLSGGQRQRLSIARAILKNPPVLILDEATASLDTESERLVQDALDKLMSNRTTIAIAHRLSTIKNADIIVVMEEGRIVEQGTHDQLISLGGVYTKLYNMQSL